VEDRDAIRARGLRPGLRSVFARRGYRRLWAARTVSQWGDAFNTVALVLLVFDRTGSGLGVTAVVAAEIVPVLLLAPIAGVVVDRVGPVRVMIGADLVRVVLAALLPLVANWVPAIYAVAFAMSAAAVFFNPAAGAALPALVDEDELVPANSGIWTAAVLSQIVLAPVAGVLVVTAGYTPAFLLNAASFAGSALLLTRLRLPRPAAAATRPSWRMLVGAGFQLVTRDRLLRALATGQFLAALSAGATSALLVVYATDQLHLDGRGYGLMLAAIGIGAATGPLLLTRLRNPRRPAFVFGPYLLRAGVDAVLAVTRTPAVALTALAGYGIGTSTGAVTFNSMLQATAPLEARGRVFATFDLTWQLGRLASLALGGIAADALGLPAVYAAGAVLLAAAAVIGWIGIRPT